jgi:phosphatidylinositol 4-kinase
VVSEKEKIDYMHKSRYPSFNLHLAAVFSEDWEAKKERIRAGSPYGHLPNWRLISVIVKNGADLRQEQFAIQLIREMQKIWEDTKVDVWVQ